MLLFGLVGLTGSATIAQSSEVDLASIDFENKSNTDKLEIINRLVAKTFYTKNRKKVTLQYIEEAEKLSGQDLSKRDLHIFKYILSWKHEHYNDFEKKIALLQECAEYFEVEKDSSMYFKSCYHLGEIFFRTGRYKTALKYLSELHKALPNIDHHLSSITVRKLVRTYSNLNQHETALEILSEYISKNESRQDFMWDGNNMRHYIVKGTILAKLGRLSEAIEYTEKAFFEAEKVNAKIILNNCKSELSRYYLLNGQVGKAKKFAQEAFDHYEILKMNYPSMTSTRVTLGDIYLKEGNYKIARKFYNGAIELAENHQRIYNHKSALAGLIECNIRLGADNEVVLAQLQKYELLKDSLLNEDINLAVQDIKIRYETEKKEAAIAQLNHQNELARSNLMASNRTNIYLKIAVLFFLLSAVLLAYMYNNKLRAQRLLEQKNDIIAESLQEKQLLLKEIHHRVKNNLQTVSSLLSLQSNYIKDENVLTALKEGQNRVQSMALIHQNLYQDDDLRSIGVKTYFNKLLTGLYQSYNIDPERIRLNLDVDDLMMDVETVVPIGLITNELVSNVFKYAFPDGQRGELNIRLKGHEPFVLIVKDNGQGMDEQLINDSTDTFGYQMIRAFCSKLNAKLTMLSENGTEIKIEIANNRMT